jgi:hypothetical protein
LDWLEAGVPELPSLTGREALTLVAVLDGIIAQVWRSHGAEMAATIAAEGGCPPVPEAVTPDDDEDLPF